ncbi:MAG: hypothetical protein JSS86_23555 [Cyanobacteria bacterium SZAS LIN-2]|nr:hypothetical protein [Cyanobacteria bacterium SZAS LIN-2]
MNVVHHSEVPAVMGTKASRKIGKAQAREQFSPLIESLVTHGGVIEVTDYGKVAAVMLSYSDYLQLLSQAQQPLIPKRQLAGSAELVGDLEVAGREISDLILRNVGTAVHEL